MGEHANCRRIASACKGKFVSSTHRLLKAGDPPLHVVVKEWPRLKEAAGGLSVVEAAALLKRARPRNGAARQPDASLVGAIKDRMLVSLEQSARASGSRRNLVGCRHDLTRFPESFDRRLVAEMSAEEIQGRLRGLGVGARRQNNLRAELVTFFHFARDHGYLPEELRTELEKVVKLHKPSGEIFYCRPSEVRRYLPHVEER